MHVRSGKKSQCLLNSSFCWKLSQYLFDFKNAQENKREMHMACCYCTNYCFRYNVNHIMTLHLFVSSRHQKNTILQLCPSFVKWNDYWKKSFWEHLNKKSFIEYKLERKDVLCINHSLNTFRCFCLTKMCFQRHFYKTNNKRSFNK